MKGGVYRMLTFHRLAIGYFARHRHGLHREWVFLPDIQLVATSGKAEKGNGHAAGNHHKIKDSSFHGYLFFEVRKCI